MRPENDRKAYVVNFCWILTEEMAEKYQLNYSYTFGNIKEHEKTVQEKIFWEIMNGVDDKVVNEKTCTFCKENYIMDNPPFFLTPDELIKNPLDLGYLKRWFLDNCEKIYQDTSMINELKLDINEVYSGKGEL